MTGLWPSDRKEIDNMKHLRKLWAALACAALLLSLATCGAGDNTQPEITGVQDQTIKAGEEFDALAGVTASDAQDLSLIHI